MDIYRGFGIGFTEKIRKCTGDICGSGAAELKLQSLFAVSGAEGFDLFLLSHDGFGVPEKFFALFSGNHAPAGPVKNIFSQLPLQFPYDFA